MGIGLALAISPDGKRLAAMGVDGIFRLWDMGNGKLKVRTMNDTAFMMGNQVLTDAAVVFSPNSKYLAVSEDDGRVSVWNAASGKKLRNWRLPRVVHGVAFAPDSRHLAIATDNGTVYLLRLAPPPGAARAAERSR